MPPSAKSGSVVTASPPPKKNEFADEAVSSLGAALAGIRVGNEVADGNTGASAYGGNVRHRNEGSLGNPGLARSGVGWGFLPASGNSSIGNASGFAAAFQAPGDPFSTSRISSSTASGVIAADVSASFPSFQSQPPTPGSAPSTPPGHRQSFDLFLSRSPSQSLGQDLLKLKQKDNPDTATPGPRAKSSNTPLGSTKQSNGNNGTSLPPGFSMRQAQGLTGSSPSVSAIGTSSSSRSESPMPNRSSNDGTVQAFCGKQTQHPFVVPPTFGQPPGDGVIHAGFVEQRNASNSNLPSTEDRQQVYWGSGLKPSQAAVGMSPVHYVGTKSLSSGRDLNQKNICFQQLSPQVGDQVQHQLFYMAVPTQDGRQVLQPVQILPAGSAPGLVALGGAHIQGQHGQAQPVVLMPAMQPSNLPMDASAPKKQHSTRNKGYGPNGQHQRTGSNVGQRHQHHDHGHHVDPGSMGDDHRLASSYLYGNPNASQDVEDQHASQPKPFGSTPPSYSQGDFYSGPRYTNPNNSQRSSPRASPAPNDFIASLYASPQRPPLNDLLGHVRRLSRDQVGCRLLQQALDEEGTMAATVILNEGLSFWGEAMVDPFGNYLFQKIAEKVSAEERVLLVRSVSARLVNASLNLHGTRSVQKVVELCAADEVTVAASGQRPPETSAEILTRSLAPAAARLCIDSHGNHVIQRILLKLPYRQSQFVFDAVAASVGDVARHRHGCCVIQRCLDSPPSEARSHLVHCIVEKSLELMQDAYGNYVVQYVLDVCNDEDVHAVCESVVGKVNLLAIQKFSSNVMEKCLERCTDRVRELYLMELSDPERIRELMMDPFGNYVIQRALAVATHSQAVRLVEAMRPHLSPQPGTDGQGNGGMRNTAGGRRIMAKICRRFPNFSVTGDGTATAQHLYQSQKQNGRQGHRHQRHFVSPVSPRPLPSKQSNLHERNHGQQQYHVAHQGQASATAGSIPSYSLQMGNGGMMYPHGM